MPPTKHKVETEIGVAAEIDLGASEIDLRALIKSNDPFTVRGTVEIDGREFTLSYVDSETGKAVVGVFESADGAPITIDVHDLAAGISTEVGDLIPSIEISVQRALFAVAKVDGQKTALIFGVEFGATIDLAELELVGPKLAGGRAAKLDGFKVLATSTDLDRELMDEVRNALGTSGFRFAEESVTTLPAGPIVSATMQLGETVHQLTIPLSRPTAKAPPFGQQSGGRPTGGKAGRPASKTTGRAVTPTPSGATASSAVVPKSETGTEKGGGVRWVNLNKTFGPVSVGRVGFRMGDGRLTLLVDADLAMGPMAFGVAGLGVSNPLTAFDPEFHLEGLALKYQSGPITISGGLLYDRTTKGFVGSATIKTPPLSISAIGGYQRLNGQDSLFIYAVLDYPIGGPAFFFVTGLALGFGYNRALAIPAAEDIPTYPLVAMAMAPPAPISPMKQLQKISDIVPAKLGEMFFAVGIKFTSFKLIDSFALLVVRVGNELAIDLLGISRISAPPMVKNPVAQAELAIRASVNITKGTLLVRGVLTSNSFILSRKCQLTGGFAFAAWFKDQSGPGGAKAGDFVVTLGGYHPDYKRPDHYPTVPRLGLRWQVTRELSIKGGMYMALTPKMIMAGGGLDAVYSRGKIRASFSLSAHFLISWQPFYYRASMDARFRFSYHIRIDLGFLGTINKKLSFNISAGVKLWGPEFGGTAHVKVSVVSFTVPFGAKVSQPGPIGWSKFAESFLPAGDDIVTLTVTAGVRTEVKGRPLVNGGEFALALNTAVPVIERAKVNGRTTGPAGRRFGLAPMNQAAAVRSAVSITVTKDGKPFDDLTVEQVTKSAPAGMWGSSMKAGMGGEAMLDNMVMGYRFLPKPVKAPRTTTDKPIEAFAYDIKPRRDAFAPLSSAAVGSAPAKTIDPDALAGNATSKTAATNRHAILAGLGLDPNAVNLDDLAADPQQAFVSDPRVIR